MKLEAKNLCVSYGKHEVLKGVDFETESGDCLAVLGPNGVGKSTLFRCLLGFIKPNSGEVTVDGKSLSSITRAETAKLIAYIPQMSSPTYNYTVLDTVLMGVTSSLPAFSHPKAEHVEKAMHTLDLLGISHLSRRGIAQISGGERQLAILARALIQNAGILIMDEPTANLDYGNKFRVMERITEIAERGYAVIFSTHEPNHALEHATRVVALKAGTVHVSGKPSEVLTDISLTELYGIGVSVGTVTLGGITHIFSAPYGNLQNQSLEDI